MEARQERGAQIVQRGGIRQRSDNLWLVPSQSHEGTWVVDYASGTPTCTCPDYEKRAAFCKHIFAIEIFLHRMAAPNQAPKKPATPRNWSAYKAAQMNEEEHFLTLLHALCESIVMPKQTGRGRPRIPLGDLVFGCVVKVYTTFSGMRANSILQRYQELGYMAKAPKPNTISDALNAIELQPLLRTLVHETAQPLAGIEKKFAIDSTGFSTSVTDRWFEVKWQSKVKPEEGESEAAAKARVAQEAAIAKKRAKFRKAHIVCGQRTHVVTDVSVTPQGDSTQFQPLVDSTGQRFNVEEIAADKAYLSRPNLEFAEKAGIATYIPFKDGTNGKKGPEIWRKMYHYYSFKREDFDAHYHQRSQVETTFSMVKRKFDNHLRSKSRQAQINEIYCKYICHNICVLITSMYDFGLEPEFWTLAKGA